MLGFIKKWLGGSNEREIKRLNETVKLVEDLEPKMQAMSDAQLRGMTDEFKRRHQSGESLDDLLPEAFAVVREGAWRVAGTKPFPVQILGGIVLHQGRIAEMKTGEGKTLTATMPAYLNAISGKGVHIVTVNDYLARFHSEWMGKIYKFLGMSVGLVLHDMEEDERQEAYNADITYATNNELGFDYLRDNMVTYRERMVQRPLNFAIVDEVDSILIDEARTPLIISGQGSKSTEIYNQADRFVRRLRVEEDYVTEEKKKVVSLTEEGTRKAEQAFNIDNLADIENNELYHHIMQALKANVLMKRDVDYVVQNGEVVIVDEFTGRLMTGRRYSEGLHQAIEAKENVKVERESRTLATITFQNYFRMYKKLSGMTGTAKTEEEEFRGIYKLDVVEIPTNKPMIRNDMNDSVYTTLRGKYNAVIEEIVRRHETGQPILVGTVSVEKSELLSDMLKRRGVKHTVLNAKFHEKEAEIVAQAGKENAVTIATNMAGRGTDILLGGNAEFLAREKMRHMGYDDEMIEDAIGLAEDVSDEVKQARALYHKLYDEHKAEIEKAHRKVVQLGGLHIIGTERHESRRIDNQLRGRAGRQGDPGSSQFFISLEDDLMRLFGSDRITPIVQRLNLEEDQAIEYGILSKQIEGAQKRVEGRNFDIRKTVLQYDDVMNQQREIIYGQRRAVLEGNDVRSNIIDMRNAIIEEAVNRQAANEEDPSTWGVEELGEYLEHVCLPEGQVQRCYDALDTYSKEAFAKALVHASEQHYETRIAHLSSAGIDMSEFERVALLNAVDRRWMDHIDAMDQLRDGIGLRAYGQKDPIVEYKFESYDMFEEMVRMIREDTLQTLHFAVLEQQPERKQVAQPTSVRGGNLDSESPKPSGGTAGKKVGRNSPCPCGSGKKYKHCCGKA